MQYAKILEKGVIIKSVPFEGSKPYDDTTPEAPDGMYAVPVGWEETETEITRSWSFVPAPDEIDDAEAFDIIFGGGDA